MSQKRLSLRDIELLKKACQNDSARELIDNLSNGGRLSDIARERGVNCFALFAKFKKVAARAGMPNITPHDLRLKFYQLEIYIKGGYDFSALSGVMEVVK